MPVYNAERFLDESICSILEQSFSNFKFLILNDASKDSSLAIIQKYARQDQRIKILQNKKNQGDGFCRNKLLKEAKTPFIAWMDADDISLKDRLKIQLKFLKDHPEIDVVACATEHFEKNKGIVVPPYIDDKSIKSAMLLINPIVGATTIIRINKQKYPYDKKVRISPDYIYWIENAGNFRYHNLTQVLYKYRIHSAGQTQSKNPLYKAHFSIIKKHLSEFSIPFTKKDFFTIRGLNKSVHWPDLEKSFDLLRQIFAIKNFYGYSQVDQTLLLKIYYSKVVHSLNKEIFLTQMEEVKQFTKKIFLSTSLPVRMILLVHLYKQIDRVFGGHCKIFFIKHFGIKAFFYTQIKIFLYSIKKTTFQHYKNFT
jgi:glycosyltransferase involved in cell wall biosynthesis